MIDQMWLIYFNPQVNDWKGCFREKDMGYQ